MEITLEKIELVRDRTGVSYKEAKEALERAEGSVVDAIIGIEESIGDKTRGKVGESSVRVVEKIKELVKKGNVSKIVIKKDDEVVLNLPINVGLLGTVIAPWAMVLGVLAAFGTKCVIEIVKEDGSIIDVSELTNETIGDVVEKGSVIADEMRNRGADVYNSVVNKTSEALQRATKNKSSDFCCDHEASDSDNDTVEEKSEEDQ